MLGSAPQAGMSADSPMRRSLYRGQQQSGFVMDNVVLKG